MDNLYQSNRPPHLCPTQCRPSRLHPTPAQAEFLVRTIGCARFIYNKLLEDRIAIREEAKEGSGTRRKPATPASYKPLFPFLAEADSLALANA
ncbi:MULTISPECIES: helix-turn-helix domain-containing protein, partial [unclassified Exiguobacterium]|uniref:helix-turn-helix domain-containing protein n=1 Tax=unclassified Exiguobacterium TaxID=2644629 RepID=UPI002036F28F